MRIVIKHRAGPISRKTLKNCIVRIHGNVVRGRYLKFGMVYHLAPTNSRYLRLVVQNTEFDKLHFMPNSRGWMDPI